MTHKHVWGPWYEVGSVWKDGNGKLWQPIQSDCTCGESKTSNKEVAG